MPSLRDPMKPLLGALTVPLVLILTGSAVSAAQPREPLEGPGVYVEVETSSPAYGDAERGQGCEVTFQGRHGGATGEIGLDFYLSQVRTRVGWWAGILRIGNATGTTVELRPGDHFSESHTLDLACSAHRRYRFSIWATGGYEYTYYYPSEDGFTQETVIDLGALSRFFDGIEPAADAEPQPVTLAGVDLNGGWTRVESTNDPNDGMRLRVEGDQAVLTYVPPSAHSMWREGSAVWREIQDDGALRVLGSNGQFYPGQLTPDGPGQLTLAVDHSGDGNDQTWVRSGDTVEGPASVPSCSWSPSAGDVWTTASTSLPAALLDALRDVKAADAPIQTLAITPDDEWVLVAGNVPCYSAGFPAGVREHIDDYIASGREIDVVAFGSDGNWIVLAEDWMRRSGVPDAVADRIRQFLDAGRRIRAFAFAPPALSAVPDGIVFVTDDGEVSTIGAFPRAFTDAVEAAEAGRRVVHDVAFGRDGGWALVAGDWFVTDGAPLALFQDLHRYRTDEDRRIDRVVLDPRRGGDRWALVSNRPEPAPTTDADQVERGMGPGSSASIWVRMKAHDIRGLAMAVIRGNRLAWARGYGLRDVGVSASSVPDFERYVYPTTAFDAASVSKPVAAVGVLQLMGTEADLERGGILEDLGGSVVPREILPALLRTLDPDGEVTLARLLSHCAGLDHASLTSGAQPFGLGAEHPSFPAMLFGWTPAAENRRVVRLDGVASGDSMRYSGTNYLLIQGLIEKHAGSFDTHMQTLLRDLGMGTSTYDTPRPDRSDYTRGYDASCGGTCAIEVYPNKAAASLTSTVIDLSRFVIMLNQNGELDRGQGAACGEDSCQILASATVDLMLKRDDLPGANLVERQCRDTSMNMALGMRVENPGSSDEVFWHRGTHNGFRAYVYGFPQIGRRPRPPHDGGRGRRDLLRTRTGSPPEGRLRLAQLLQLV